MRYARRLAETPKKWQHERDVGRDGDMEWRRGSKDQTLTAGTVERLFLALTSFGPHVSDLSFLGGHATFALHLHHS